MIEEPLPGKATESAIAFDGPTHTYWINGARAIGVTESLKESGVIKGIEFIGEDALWRGQVVHHEIGLYHDGKSVWANVDEQIKPYLEAYFQFLKDTGFTPRTWEKRIANQAIGLAGTYDVEGPCRGEEWLIDFKSSLVSRAVPPWVGLQLADYDILLGPSKPPRRRFGLKLLETGKYNLVCFKNPADYSVALGCVNLLNWRKQHGI